MPNPNPASGAHQATPDTQTLVALLESLMPLLLRFQSQSLGQQPFPSLDPGSLMISNAVLDHQAAVNLVEDITAHTLRTLSIYLETNAPNHAELQSCVGIVAQAAHCFAARDYGQSFALIWQAYRAITMLRAINPQLPPLRALAASVSPSPSTTSLH